MADKYDEITRRILREEGLPADEKFTSVRKSNRMPSNTAGLPGLMVREMPYLSDTNTKGFVLSSNALADEKQNRGLQQNMFVEPGASAHTVGHEAEHLLARQNAGFTQMPRDTFQDMLGQKSYRYTRQFLDGLKESLPYLKKKYGIENDGYMTPEFIDKQGGVGLYEIFATLAGTEAAQGVDLTKDPELRKTMFKDKGVREAYNAVTGLRQTRLDARDIPPYTRVPEKEPEGEGVVGKLKKMVGMKKGGVVKPMPNAGGNKLI